MSNFLHYSKPNTSVKHLNAQNPTSKNICKALLSKIHVYLLRLVWLLNSDGAAHSQC